LLAKKRENGLGEVDEMFLDLLLDDQEDGEEPYRPLSPLFI
jgi:hypothetical protein